MIRVKSNAGEFTRLMRAEVAHASAKVDRTFRGLAVSVFEYIVKETPQWSGHTASNWNFGVGSPNDSVNGEFLGSVPWRAAALKHKGDPEAVGVAFHNNAGADRNVMLSDTIYITNDAKDKEGNSTYLQNIETSPEGFLREENLPGQMMASAKSDFDVNYATLSEVDEAFLMNLRISGLLA